MLWRINWISYWRVVSASNVCADSGCSHPSVALGLPSDGVISGFLSVSHIRIMALYSQWILRSRKAATQ